MRAANAADRPLGVPRDKPSGPSEKRNPKRGIMLRRRAPEPQSAGPPRKPRRSPGLRRPYSPPRSWPLIRRLFYRREVSR